MNNNDIFIVYGSPRDMTLALLQNIDICSLVGDKHAKIGIKPNLVVPRPASEGATTHPVIVDTLVEYLIKNGYRDICIIESSWVGDSTKRAFKACGYEQISQKHSVPLYDVKDDSYRTVSVDRMDIEVSNRVLDLDFLINIPVLKGHCQTSLTCALKNLKGCISDKSKRYFHTIGLHKPIAALSSVVKNSLVIVDSICGDLDFEEGGNPVTTNRMLACTDPVLVDAYAAGLLGYEVRDIPYISMACDYGVGNCDITSANVIPLNSDAPPSHVTPSTRKIKNLEGYICEKSACSACYGNLIHALCRMKDIGKLTDVPKLHIGQNFISSKSDGVGIGRCCSGFSRNIGGCPPKPVDIVNFLKCLQ